MSRSRMIEAFKAYDGKVFESEKEADDYQEGIRAHALLELINHVIPENYRERLTYMDWRKVGIADLERKSDKELIKALRLMLDILEFENTKDIEND